MLFRNALVFTDGEFVRGGFEVENGRFIKIYKGDTPDGGTDLGGKRVIPGLIDIHTHGNSGADFSDGDYEALVKAAKWSADNGVTSFAPASMTLPYDVLEKAFASGRRLKEEAPRGCARFVGINMEGPFFSEKKKGAQNGAYLSLPDIEAFKKLYDGCGGLIKIVDVAPELHGAVEFAREASKLCRVSAAHTDADYEQSCAMFDAGATHMTHLFNAMPGIHHRKPGPIGAASERDDVTAELICDGLHVHPSAVRMAFKLFPGRICLVSDSLRCCGMPNGQYELGGQAIWLQDRIARLADGTIAGSASSLYDCMVNAVKFGIPAEEAVIAATLTPAKVLGCENEIGSVSEGKRADFVVCWESFERMAVYIDGEKL